MALTEIDETGASYPVDRLSHQHDFDQVWLLNPAAQRAADPTFPQRGIT